MNTPTTFSVYDPGMSVLLSRELGDALVCESTKYDSVINAGVELLDARVGRDVWLPRVDLDTLDVGTANACVATQATCSVDFFTALARLGVSVLTENSGQYGFCLTTQLIESNASYAGLTMAWKQRIKRLRAER